MTPESLYIAEDVVTLLRRCPEEARPLETGGVLVGVLRDGDPWITSAVEVIDERRTSASFIIPKGITPYAVEAAQEHDGRVGYLGDWHSHPANVGASPTDKATLGREARRKSRSKKAPAILIVVRDAPDGWVIDAMRDRGAGPAPVEVILTGPMAAMETIDAG